jgi:hypothetical protein
MRVTLEMSAKAMQVFLLHVSYFCPTFNKHYNVSINFCKVSQYLPYLLTELIPAWEAENCAATQELPSILWNPKLHYHVHKSPPIVPILSQINPVHTIPSYLRSILILSTHLRLGLPSGLFPSASPTNILYGFFSPIRSTCHAHLILLHLIILCEEYNLWSSSLCSFLQSPVFPNTTRHKSQFCGSRPVTCTQTDMGDLTGTF